MKKAYFLAAAILLGMLTSACAGNDTAVPVAKEESAIQILSSEESSSLEEDMDGTESSPIHEETSDVDNVSSTAEEDASDDKESSALEEDTFHTPEPSSLPQTDSQPAEDNFSIDIAEAVRFAESIQAAVADQDIEALSELAAYPIYIGFPDGGVSVETAEDFMDLEAESLFTPDLLESIAQADKDALSPSMAGFVLTQESGAPNIVFGVVSGDLKIQGINY